MPRFVNQNFHLLVEKYRRKVQAAGTFVALLELSKMKKKGRLNFIGSQKSGEQPIVKIFSESKNNEKNDLGFAVHRIDDSCAACHCSAQAGLAGRDRPLS
jgi:hypothetical protein